ncbi:hypothetical protein HYDPIDRAFT_108894 [Hydnomerulius pinastri MD-312]|nr:hypothetical protein HYDPIDRAFT_108894 [Hydnomerulius pinastri MD-312]
MAPKNNPKNDPKPNRDLDSSPINVALVGVTGVGKSTLVNMIKLQDSASAEANNDARPCTGQATRYDGKLLCGTKLNIWDTRGLNEASEKGADGTFELLISFFKRPSEADRELKKFLRKQDIHLVLWCIEEKNIRAAAQWKSYRKISADYCRNKVKVAVVVTQVPDTKLNGQEWKNVCQGKVKDMVGKPLDEKLLAGLPVVAVGELQKKDKCKEEILKLIESQRTR